MAPRHCSFNTAKSACCFVTRIAATAALHIADAIPGIHVACVAKQGRGLERDGVRITLQRQKSDGGLIINTLIIAERQGCLSLSAEPGVNCQPAASAVLTVALIFPIPFRLLAPSRQSESLSSVQGCNPGYAPDTVRCHSAGHSQSLSGHPRRRHPLWPERTVPHGDASFLIHCNGAHTVRQHLLPRHSASHCCQPGCS